MDDVRKLIRAAENDLRQGKSAPDFFGFVRRVAAAAPEKALPGCAALPANDVFRFGQVPELSFQLGDIAEITRSSRHGEYARVVLRSFGLFGPLGPMPLEITEMVLQRSMNHYDHAMRHFADILHHRFISQYWRAWAERKSAVMLDRPENNLIGSVFGVYAHATRETARVLAPGLIQANSGFLAQPARSVQGLEEMLRSHFGFVVSVRSFVPSTSPVPPEFRLRLGQAQSGRLGESTVLGKSVPRTTQLFRLVVGPFDYERLARLFPGTTGFDDLVRLVSLWLDKPLDWELQLIFYRDTLPAPQLTGRRALGRGIWLSRKKHFWSLRFETGLRRMAKIRTGEGDASKAFSSPRKPDRPTTSILIGRTTIVAAVKSLGKPDSTFVRDRNIR